MGKWVKIFLNDKEYKGLYQVAVIAVNNNYILFEEKFKKGVLKLSDIKSISDADISKRKLEKIHTIITKDILDDYNPYQQFAGKKCHIRLKCNSFFAFPQGYYDTKINSVTEDAIVITQREKTIAIKISDVLMIFEN